MPFTAFVRRLLQRLSLIAVLLLMPVLSGLAATAPAHPVPPKLVVVLVVDGLPQRQVLAYRDQLAPDGFARFLRRGVWFSQAHYGQSHTVTAVGHALLLTGAYPQRSGIIGNEWRDPATGEPVYCTGDTSATYIGHSTRAFDGTSPRNLRVETVGDMLKRASPASRVIAVSGKDRGAILLAGKSGSAYMYMAASGQFASSTYYMAQHPAWVDQFNAQRLADGYVGQYWRPLLPDAAYARSLSSEQSWIAPGQGKLPLRYGNAGEAAGARFYGSLLLGPFVDALTLDFARAAIAAEGLGQGSATDILAVSLSGHDYVNHAFSAESRASHDHVLQLDRQLQSFFRYLDQRVGRGNYLAVLSADHGFMPAPQHSVAQGRDAQRLNPTLLLGRLNQELAARFGPGKWLHGFSGSGLLLNTRLIEQTGANRVDLANATRDLLLATPGIAAAYTAQELAHDGAAMASDSPYLHAMRRSYSADVPVDVQLVLQPWWMLSSGQLGATHGSPHEPDTHVPLMLYGPRVLRKPAQVDAPVLLVDLAPTLAHLLGIAAPSTVQGQALHLP